MMQFLDHNSELVLLLVNTLLSDLKSDNFVAGGLLGVLPFSGGQLGSAAVEWDSIRLGVAARLGWKASSSGSSSK